MAKALPSSVRDAGSIPGQGAKVPHASWPIKQNIRQDQHCNKFSKDFKNIYIKQVFKTQTYFSFNDIIGQLERCWRPLWKPNWSVYKSWAFKDLLNRNAYEFISKDIHKSIRHSTSHRASAENSIQVHWWFHKSINYSVFLRWKTLLQRKWMNYQYTQLWKWIS